MAADRGWDVDPARLYDRWDAANKASQRDLAGWTTFAGHSARAMAAAQAGLGLAGDPAEDAAELLASVGDWPLWPDVAEGLPAVAAAGYRVGVLSNVDDDVFVRTRVAPLVEDAAVLTSERLRAYKPAPALYLRARERAGGRLTHVATSARDVRGALEAGLAVVRLVRPGHDLDPAGPRPADEVLSLHDLVTVLDTRGDTDHDRGRT
jgi:2-haloalkanoic acid dehalogenase type II